MKKKRERKARPVVFTEGHAQIEMLFDNIIIRDDRSFFDNNYSFFDSI